mgnify:CR=1 FL=1
MQKALFIILFSFSFSVFAQSNLPYKLGEVSKFTISFGLIDVGSADLEIVETKKIGNKQTFHIVGKGKTSPFFDWFFKVRDIYETYIDTSSLLPVKFLRDINEGGYKINQKYRFFHNDSIVETQDSVFKIPPNAQDMLSALFYARTFNKKDLKRSNSFFVPIFMDNENYFLEILYLHNEILDTKWGKVNCMVFKPKMQEGRIFESGEQMKIWIADDFNHLLMQVETKIWAGTIKAVLIDYKSLKTPFTIIQGTKKEVKL